MPDFTPDDKKRLFMTLDAQTEQLRSLQRAVYGDKDNGVKGMVERMTTMEAWITKSMLKVAYISGAVSIIVVLSKLFWDWLISSFKK